MAFLFTTLFSKCLVDNCFRRLRAFFQVKNIFQITSAELLLYIGSVRNLPIFFLMDRLEFRESLLGQSRGQVSKGILIKNYLESLTDFSFTEKVVIGKMEIFLKNIPKQFLVRLIWLTISIRIFGNDKTKQQKQKQNIICEGYARSSSSF